MKNIKIKMLAIIIFIIITGIVISIIVQNNKRKNDNDDNKDNISIKYQKIDDTKDFIYIHEGNVYEVNFNEGKQVSFDYPVININTLSVKKLNDSIKEQFDNLEKDYKRIGTDDDCTCIKIDGIFRCTDVINSLHYITVQEQDYYQILLYSFINTNCASGGSELTSYIISSLTGEVLSNKEIIEYFGYDSNKLLQKYNEYRQNEYPHHLDVLIENIDDLSLMIHNSKLIVINNHHIGDGYDTLIFDGKNIELYYDYDDPIKVQW